MAGYKDQPMHVGEYDVDRFDFSTEIAVLATQNIMLYAPDDALSRLHEIYSPDKLDFSGADPAALERLGSTSRENDQYSLLLRHLYASIEMRQPDFRGVRRDFLRTYRAFMYSVVQPMLEEEIIFQRMPTLRIHQPGSLAVGEYHTDAKYGHPPEATNVWVPLTDAYDSNTIQIQLEPDAEPKPVNLKVGEFLLFDGTGLTHGNETNQTPDTRVSFDARVIPKRLFRPSDKASIGSGIPFKIGGYYDTFEDDYEPPDYTREKPAAEPAPQPDLRQRMFRHLRWLN